MTAGGATPRLQQAQRGRWLLRGCLLGVLLFASGCQSILFPSNNRDWTPDQAVLPSAEIRGSQIDLHNIRNCQYRTTDEFTVEHYDKTVDLNQLTSVDYIVVPFPEAPALAHTMMSFGFNDRDFVAVSVEIRKERGESFHPVKGSLRQYEIMYVLGDERDLIKLRTNYRLNDVYVYRARATPEQLQGLFLDVMKRVNKLVDEPEFYDTLTNNCTTNIAQHINRLRPNRVPLDYRVLLPGLSDRLAYDLGLLDTTLSFEQTKERARVNELAYVHRDSADFSQLIRR